MDPDFIEFLIAAVTMTLSNVAGLSVFLQTRKIIKMQKTGAVAVSPFYFMMVTNTFWLLYGLMRQDPVLIIPAAIWMASVGSVIFVYYMYKK